MFGPPPLQTISTVDAADCDTRCFLTKMEVYIMKFVGNMIMVSVIYAAITCSGRLPDSVWVMTKTAESCKGLPSLPLLQCGFLRRQASQQAIESRKSGTRGCPLHFVPTMVQNNTKSKALNRTTKSVPQQQITGPRGQLLQHIPVAVCAEAEALTAIGVQA